MKNIIGDSICVLRVKVEVEDGFAELAASEIAKFQPDVRNGKFDENYPNSLIESVLKNIKGLISYEISGPRSAIAIPLRFIKTFAPESNVAFSSKVGDGGCSKLVSKFLQEWGVLNALQVCPNSDCAVEFKCVSPNGELFETVIRRSSSKNFKHSFDLEEIEKNLGLEFNTILLNRPRIGFANALKKIKARENSLASLIIHDFSRYQNATNYLEYATLCDFVFITAEDSDKSIIKQTQKVLGANSKKQMAEKIVNLANKEKMFILPPSVNATGEDKFVTFFQTSLSPVRVEIPDKVRKKLKTAWLNGACVALAIKDWSKCENPPAFQLDGNLPKSQKDLEIFANWAVNMAYFGYPEKDFIPQKNLIIKTV